MSECINNNGDNNNNNNFRIYITQMILSNGEYDIHVYCIITNCVYIFNIPFYFFQNVNQPYSNGHMYPASENFICQRVADAIVNKTQNR